MTLLNVSFGIYAIMPQGWIFMVLIIAIECFSMSYLLEKIWRKYKVSWTVIGSNIISGAAGFIISMILNGGWWLVIWLPWVSDNEVQGKIEIKGLILYYLAAFFLTLIIETIFNYSILRKSYKAKQIILATILINVLSYSIGSIALYTYSFN